MIGSLSISPALTGLLTDRVTVYRRQENVNGYGEGGVSNQKFPNVACTVFPGGQNKLDRRPEAQSSTKVVELVTRFALRLASPGWQTDVIEWRGDHYTVVDVQDYSRYGQGFVHAIAEARPVLQTPPEVHPL